jgi:hypothetical protein
LTNIILIQRLKNRPPARNVKPRSAEARLAFKMEKRRARREAREAQRRAAELAAAAAGSGGASSVAPKPAQGSDDEGNSSSSSGDGGGGGSNMSNNSGDERGGGHAAGGHVGSGGVGSRGASTGSRPAPAEAQMMTAYDESRYEQRERIRPPSVRDPSMYSHAPRFFERLSTVRDELACLSKEGASVMHRELRRDKRKNELNMVSSLQILSAAGKMPEGYGSAAIGSVAALPTLQPVVPAQPMNAVRQNELVLTVSYHQAHPRPVRMQEFRVLGSQPLSVLCDQIYCLTNVLCKWHEDPPQMRQRGKKSTHDDEANPPPSQSQADHPRHGDEGAAAIDHGAEGAREEEEEEEEEDDGTRTVLGLSGPDDLDGRFLFIEDVFYVDRRTDPETGLAVQDLASVVVNWASDEKRRSEPGLSSLKISPKSIHEAKFEDLSIKLGEPYLFVHRGNCEHVIIFEDARLITRHDNLDRSAYPLTVFQNRIRRRKCKVCAVFIAVWITFADPQAPEEPCYFCEECYNRLHYEVGATRVRGGKEVKPLYDYDLYQYFHD